AACFSMALSAGLEKAGKPASRIQTDAGCTLEMVNGTPTITKMELRVRGKVPGLDQAGFQKAADEAKIGCPVSRALKGIPQITLTAKLNSRQDAHGVDRVPAPLPGRILLYRHHERPPAAPVTARRGHGQRIHALPP